MLLNKSETGPVAAESALLKAGVAPEERLKIFALTETSAEVCLEMNGNVLLCLITHHAPPSAWLGPLAFDPRKSQEAMDDLKKLRYVLCAVLTFTVFCNLSEMSRYCKH